ncbi:MAG: chromosomal replication initiator protein DnaA [Candidatus Magasanikbacteria bacterium]|nr:chromosomal replication initiator protein DnaA [Candidatus Magasanikbacteria bacterium]
MTNYEIWQAVLAEFELTVSKANFTTWFRSTGIASYVEGRVTVCVPNTFTKSWLEKKYNSDLVKTIERVTGKPVKKMEYKVENVKNIEEQECFKKELPTVSTPKTPMYSNTIKKASQFGLQTKYTFDTFIVGKQNELAHAASQAVAAKPGEAYNPLFIYGDVGLGKTHLLQAVGHAILAKNPQTKILYVSSEKFTNEFVMSVKEGRAKEFKDKYRTVDLLLIDDIQFIAGKEQTQEEFFHTFNELHQHGKQVLMTSDRPPKAIPALEERLRSRFEWGMIADVSAPDLETRVAILQAKCQEKNIRLEEKYLQLIATQVQNNIRELEGALNKISAFHQLNHITLDEEGINSILKTIVDSHAKKSTTPREIIQTVMTFFDITHDDIMGKSREKRVSLPRQIAMHLLRQELDMSFPNIGQELGGRDHTTAIHAHNKIKREKDRDLKIKQDVELIKQRLYSTNN